LTEARGGASLLPMTFRHSAFLAFIALAFLVRALVPTGFMPDFSGKHAIQICSGTDLVTVYVDGNGNPAPAHSGDESSGSCPFSFLSAALSPEEGFSAQSYLDVPVVTALGMVSRPAVTLRRFAAGNPVSSRSPPTA
jgi:hypothetical protein